MVPANATEKKVTLYVGGDAMRAARVRAARSSPAPPGRLHAQRATSTVSAVRVGGEGAVCPSGVHS
jgi:hypothetical protein